MTAQFSRFSGAVRMGIKPLVQAHCAWDNSGPGARLGRFHSNGQAGVWNTPQRILHQAEGSRQRPPLSTWNNRVYERG